MIENKPAIVSLMILALVVVGSAQAQSPPQGAYAYGFPIQTPGPADFYRIELPLVLYGSAADPSLRDLGVYDGAGQPVPRVLETRRVQRPTPEQKITLNTFALPDTTPPTGDEIRVLLRRTEHETSVQLNANRNGSTHRTSSLSYLIDVKNRKHPLEALEFQWQDTQETFLGQAAVTGSNDLVRWTPAGNGAVVAMREADADIVQRRVTLLGKHHDYLRVVFDGVPDSFVVTETAGIYTGSVPEAPRQWLEQTPTSQDNDGGLVFDVGHSPPVDRVHVRLAADNVVVRGTLTCWPATGDHWVRLHQGVFYHLRQANHSVQSTPVTIPQQRASRWKLAIDRGRTDVDVKLALGWRPDRLVFVAQGQGPYTLAVGRAADAVDGFPQESMFGDRAILNLLTQNRQPAVAYLGERFDLGGSQALVIDRPIRWQTLTLWGTLILGVGLVSWMVFSLARQLRTGDR